MIKLYLLRHGECADEIFLRGRHESLMSDKGIEQVTQAAQHILRIGESEKVFIISSHAKRCQQAYNHLLHRFPKVLFAFKNDTTLSRLWMERDFGVLDGLAYHDAVTQYPDELNQYLKNPFDYSPKDSETFFEFEQRMYQAWNTLLDRLLLENPKEVLLVTHAGPMRWVFSEITGAPINRTFHIQLGYASLMTIEIHPSVSSNSLNPFLKLISFQNLTNDLPEQE